MKKKMELRNPSNGETLEPPIPTNNGEHLQNPIPYPDDVDSNCSTPYVSAPSSPGRAGGGAYYFSAPSSPMHYVLSSGPFSSGGISSATSPDLMQSSSVSFEFGGSSASGPMISADELFLDGQIRPMKLSSHLRRPQALAPLLDLDEEEDEAKDEANGGRGREIRLRSRSIHRRSRSMSPIRNFRSLPWEEKEEEERKVKEEGSTDLDPKPDDPVTATDSASSSRSSSGRNSKRWIFLKDFLYRSKSDGGGRGGNGKEKFWSFSPAKDKSSKSPRIPPSTSEIEKDKTTKKNGNGNRLGKRPSPAPSAHERLYTANRAQAEEMRRRTFLPYRQGLFGCLGFSSKGYGAVNGLAKTISTVSSR